MLKRSIKKLAKKTLWYLQGGYKPKAFWNTWAKTFMDDPWQKKILPQHPWILEKIMNTKPQSILEVGCGFGRNIKYLIDNGIDPAIITGTDISDTMLVKARKFLKSNQVTFQPGKAESLPFPDKSFDVTLIHAVFMHVKPQDIDQAIDEVKRVSKNYIIVIEQNYLPAGEASDANEYTFVHDYSRLFKTRKMNVVDFVADGKYGYYYYFIKLNT